MQNILINMCEKFHYTHTHLYFTINGSTKLKKININTHSHNRLRNNRALGKRKSENSKNPKNKNKTTTRTTFVAIGDPFPGPKVSSRYCRYCVVVVDCTAVVMLLMLLFRQSFGSADVYALLLSFLACMSIRLFCLFVCLSLTVLWTYVSGKK